MTCEEARWLEFESEEARAHAAGCAECGEWVADGVALRGLADEAVPVPRATRRWLRTVVAAAVAAVAGVWVAMVPRQEIPPPPIPVVAVAKPVLPAVEVQVPTQAPVVARRKAVAPLYLKIETSDPDVIIYWTVEGGEE
ncbi:MAG: hypothetical protein JNK87_09080 [Bryobacterales bacterium]|nr:hypothetical protein [Bryobacterales bacterium]